MKSFFGMTRQGKTRFVHQCERNDAERSEDIAEEYGASIAGAIKERE